MSPSVALAEAWEWVEERGRVDAFGFESICVLFDLEPDAVRAALRRGAVGRVPWCSLRGGRSGRGGLRRPVALQQATG